MFLQTEIVTVLQGSSESGARKKYKEDHSKSNIEDMDVSVDGDMEENKEKRIG